MWGAVTPLAADLTVHAGKGLTPVAARVSAVMEAVERVCAEAADPATTRRARFDRRDGALDPAAFDLPFETVYTPEREITWVQGHDLLVDRPVWVAADLVISPAREGVCRGVETNGLAAGNTRLEAIVHGLLELIERDAYAQRRFATLYADPERIPPARLLDPGSLPDTAAALLAALDRAGVQIVLEDLTGDLDIPVFRAGLLDRDFPGAAGPRRFDGAGCDLDPENALVRAITEAVQSHTAVLIGARDDFEGGPRHAQPGGEGLVRRLLGRSAEVAFQPRPAPADLHARLAQLLDRLERARLTHAVAVELTRPHLGIPVVRVLVPGLAAPYGDSTRRPAARLLSVLR